MLFPGTSKDAMFWCLPAALVSLSTRSAFWAIEAPESRDTPWREWLRNAEPR